MVQYSSALHKVVCVETHLSMKLPDRVLTLPFFTFFDMLAIDPVSACTQTGGTGRVAQG
jgi:hypothetical protein